jgi:hypothetical protein
MGLSLTELMAQLAALEINPSSCHSQARDIGVNMVDRHQRVQSRILCENPRAFVVSFSAQILNLLLGDIASSMPMVIFFGKIQYFYTIFAASTEKQKILSHMLLILL